MISAFGLALVAIYAPVVIAWYWQQQRLAAEIAQRARLEDDLRSANNALKTILSVSLGVQIPEDARVSPDAVVRQVLRTGVRGRERPRA